jgi:hypothetical protein
MQKQELSALALLPLVSIGEGHENSQVKFGQIHSAVINFRLFLLRLQQKGRKDNQANPPKVVSRNSHHQSAAHHLRPRNIPQGQSAHPTSILTLAGPEQLL